MIVEKRVVFSLPLTVGVEGYDYVIKDSEGHVLCSVPDGDDDHDIVSTLLKFITAGIEAVGQ